MFIKGFFLQIISLEFLRVVGYSCEYEGEGQRGLFDSVTSHVLSMKKRKISVVLREDFPAKEKDYFNDVRGISY